MGAFQTGTQTSAGVARAGGLHQEPADESDPQSTEAFTREETENTETNKQERYKVPGSRGQFCGQVLIFILRPDQRAQNPDTAKGKARNHVEFRQLQVDIAKP